MIDLERVKNYRPRTVFYSRLAALRRPTPAAVLLLIHRVRETAVFIVRSNTVRQHRGQIGLPGGVIEKGEAPRDAALREAREEIGQESSGIEIIGAVDRLQTITGFLVHPFIALWRETGPLVPDESEVDEIFEVPLDFLLDPANIRLERWKRFCFSKDMFFWEYEGRTIWGVTGDILAAFHHVVTGTDLSDLLEVSESRMREFWRR